MNWCSLFQAMKQIKATGIDFIIPSGKPGSVHWDSRIASEELVANRGWLLLVRGRGSIALSDGMVTGLV
jgi:hypothetical protein